MAPPIFRRIPMHARSARTAAPRRDRSIVLMLSLLAFAMAGLLAVQRQWLLGSGGHAATGMVTTHDYRCGPQNHRYPCLLGEARLAMADAGNGRFALGAGWFYATGETVSLRMREEFPRSLLPLNTLGWLGVARMGLLGLLLVGLAFSLGAAWPRPMMFLLLILLCITM